MIIIDLFAGIGGNSLAFDTIFHEQKNTHIFCEIDPFCQAVLRKHWPDAYIHDDIRTFADPRGIEQRRLSGNGRKKVSPTGVSDKPFLLTGGFPCQPFSQAGRRRGTEDDRYLWPAMLGVIRATQPQWVIAENVRGILTIEHGMVFEQVCLDLESAGYEVQPLIIPAVAVNAPHRRDRVWFIAHRRCEPCGKGSRQTASVSDEKAHARTRNNDSDAPNAKNHRSDRRPAQERWNVQDQRERETLRNQPHGEGYRPDWSTDWHEVAAKFCRVDDELSSWMDRYFNDVIYWRYEDCQEDKKKALSILFKAIQSPEIRQKIGGLWQVEKAQILLETVCQLQKRIGEPERLHISGEEVSQGEMRVLPQYGALASSPQRRRHHQQLAKELTNIVPKLPHEIALEVVETGSVLWGAYSSIYSQEVNTDGLKLSASAHRKARLKGLGNAIVPQVAMEIMQAIKTATW